MKLYKALIICVLSLGTFLSYAQPDVLKKMKEGSKYHNNKEYSKAIETYKEVLKMNPDKKTRVHYKIGYSFFKWGKKEQAFMHLQKAKEYNDGNLTNTYILLSTYYKEKGFPQKSIEILDEGIKQQPKNYLLHYNQGVNYYKVKDLESALKEFKNTIKTQPMHPPSNFQIARIENRFNNRIPAALSAYIFLLAEHNSKRSQEALEILFNNLTKNTKLDSQKTVHFQMGEKGGDFSEIEKEIDMAYTAELMVNPDMTHDETLYEITKVFFENLSKIKDPTCKLYVPYFAPLVDSKHLQTFCYFISQSKSNKAVEWIKKHHNEVDDMFAFIKKSVK